MLLSRLLPPFPSVTVIFTYNLRQWPALSGGIFRGCIEIAPPDTSTYRKGITIWVIGICFREQTLLLEFFFRYVVSNFVITGSLWFHNPIPAPCWLKLPCGIFAVAVKYTCQRDCYVYLAFIFISAPGCRLLKIYSRCRFSSDFCLDPVITDTAFRRICGPHKYELLLVLTLLRMLILYFLHPCFQNWQLMLFYLCLLLMLSLRFPVVSLSSVVSVVTGAIPHRLHTAAVAKNIIGVERNQDKYNFVLPFISLCPLYFNKQYYNNIILYRLYLRKY